MGSRVQKIAFLMFALMFVAVIAVLNSTILTMGTSANTQLTTIVTSDDSALGLYDEATVYGSVVAKCAKDPDKVASTDMSIYVFTAASAAGKEYTTAASYPQGATVDNINMNAKFDSYLVNNNNGVTIGILFVQDGTTPTAAAVEALCNTSTGNNTIVNAPTWG